MISLKTYKDAFPTGWALYWFWLPMAAIMVMWLVGGPPMTPALAAYGLAALVVAQLPWTWPKRIALVGMAGYVFYYYVTTLFNLNRENAAMLPGFIMEVRPMQSPIYAVAALVLLGSIGWAAWRAPQVRRFSSPMSFILAVCVIFATLVVDFMATASTRESYRSAPPEGAEYHSASSLAGLEAPDGSGRNLVIVLVEGLGQPVDKVGRDLFAQAWDRPHWRARYNVAHGTLPFFGSTTNGELRELCNAWGKYADFDFAGTRCLPRRYREAGYHTSAWHGFDPALFDRDRWYPALGFDTLTFRDELEKNGARECPGVFPGACDTDIGKQIHARLQQAEGPQLVYWLTLNTHLPILADKTLGTDRCTLGPEGWAGDNPQICRLFLAHRHLADAIDEIASDPDLPPTDFVIVGDHFPPFFDRNSRLMFDAAEVPWVTLRARSVGDGTVVAEKAPAEADRG